jgi:hypothetical protein
MLLCFMTIWNIFQSFGIIYSLLRSFGIFFPFGIVWVKKNLATLKQPSMECRRGLIFLLGRDFVFPSTFM